MYLVGEHFLDGKRGFPESEQEAFKWFDRASQKGFIKAYEHLIICYRHGVVPANPEKALEYSNLVSEARERDVQNQFFELVQARKFQTSGGVSLTAFSRFWEKGTDLEETTNIKLQHGFQVS